TLRQGYEADFGGLDRKIQRHGVTIWSQNTKAKRSREAESSADRMIRGVLEEKAQEAGAGTYGGVGNAKVNAIEATFSSLGGVVAPVASPGKAKLRDQRGLFEKRDFFRRNRITQIRNQHLAECVAITQGGEPRHLMRELHGAFVTRFGK